jgi:peptidoglycan/LPS O-acetylase OafA/YrhL
MSGILSGRLDEMAGSSEMTAAARGAFVAAPPLGYRPALDGLRGVAVILVLLYHLPLGLPTEAGPVGVAMFFTLSGFLITTLLLEEHVASGRIDLPQFYKRRALRLLPALVAMMGLLVILDVVVGSQGDYRRPALLTLLYVANWAIIAGIDFGHINHTWTLAVEEHFYLLWPLAVVIVLNKFDRKTLLRVAIAGAVASWGLRVALWASGASLPRVLYATDTRLDGLLIGCIFALMGWGRVTRVPRTVTVAGLTALGVAIAVRNEWFNFAIGYTAVSVATVIVIAGCLTSYRPHGLLSQRPLVPIGRISYGLYLWHLPVYGLVFKYGDGFMSLTAQSVSAVALSLAVALCSYFVIERPFLRLKHGANRRHTTGALTAPSSSTPKRQASG